MFCGPSQELSILNSTASMGALDSLFPPGDYKMFVFVTTRKSEFIGAVTIVGSATTSTRDVVPMT